MKRLRTGKPLGLLDSVWRVPVVGLLVVLCLIDPAYAAPTQTWIQGTNYDVIDPPQPTASSANKIEVIEFFGYWCPHCRDFEPSLESWSNGIAADVALVRIPVVWGAEKRTRQFATFYYTLLALDRLDLHHAFFNAIYLAKKSDTGSLQSFEKQRAFVVAHGVPAGKFEALYRSPAVLRAVDQAAAMTDEYKVIATPTIAIQGMYRTDPTQVQGGWVEFLSLMDYLIARVRSSSGHA